MNAGDLFDKIENENLHKEFTEQFFNIVFNQMDERTCKTLMAALVKKMEPYFEETVEDDDEEV